MKHRIPTKVFKAMLKIESNFNLNKVNKKTKDYGIAQINIRNIKHFKLNKLRLTTDLDYSLDNGAKIASYFFKRYNGTLGYKWVAKYNCGTKIKCENTKASKKYLVKVYAAMN